MIREHLQNDVISFNTRLTNWLDQIEENSKTIITKVHDDEVVVVDGDAMHLERKSGKSKISASLSCLHLPIESSYEKELMWINDISRRSQIKFGSEEIVQGNKELPQQESRSVIS